MQDLLSVLSHSITRTIAVLLVALFSISASSLYFVSAIGTEFKSVTEEDIPLTDLIIQVIECQLERAINVERAMLYASARPHIPRASVDFEGAHAAFLHLGERLSGLIDDALELMGRTIEATSSPRTQEEYRSTKQALSALKQDLLDFERHAQQAFIELSANGLTEQIMGITEALEAEEDQLDLKTESLLRDISAFTRESSEAAKRHEQMAFRLLAALCLAGAICVAMLTLHTRKTVDAILLQVKRLGAHDPLTGLLNRREFLCIAQKYSQLAKREKKTFSLLMVDLDHFKRINDEHGHPTGDEVLRSFSRVARNALRESDSIGRFGGEEFAILLPNTDATTALLSIQRLHEAIRDASVEAGGKLIRYTASMGLASSTDDAEGVNNLIDQADKALYYAKAHGRNCTASFNSETHTIDLIEEQLTVINPRFHGHVVKSL